MKSLAARISKLLQNFNYYVMKNNKEELVPKLMSNSQLSTKYIESNKKEIAEQAEFLKFHETIAAGERVNNSGCHCSIVSTSREKLK